MSTRNRFSPLAPDDPFPQLPPSPEGHQIIEFEWRPAAPVEARVPLQVNSAVPSFTQDEEQGSFHEVRTLLSMFERLIEHRVTLAGGYFRVHP